MLNLICGSLFPDSGNVEFEGKDITKLPEFRRAKFLGRVFQDPKFGTCDGLTILENMSLADNKNKAYSLLPALNKRRYDYYRTLLEECELGLENRMNIPVGNLSGGQRQALALVIANITKIDMLILDEHTAALDPKTAEIIMELTDKVIREKHLTAMMVTHNLRHAVEYGDRLLMLNQGHVVMDRAGEEKARTSIDEVMETFNRIALETGA